MKKVITLVLALGLVLALFSGCGTTGSGSVSSTGTTAAASSGSSAAAADDFKGVEWTLAHTRSDDSRAAKAAVAFADAVSEATDGKIKITVYGNASLGDYTTVQERVTLGDVTMQMADLAKTLDTSMIIPTIPYIISTWDEFEQYYHVGADGAKIADFAADRLTKQGITLISCYPQYFGTIASAKPIENWDNPTASKGLKVRIPTEKAFENLSSLFGFQGTGMAASEAYTAIQTGVVDGFIGGGTEYYWNQYRDVVSYILPINTHPVCYWLYINSEALSSIPQDYQDIVMELADQYLYTAGLEDAKSEGTMYEDNFTKQGATVYDVSDELLAEYTDTYRQQAWPQIATEDYLGKDGLALFQQFMDQYNIKY